MKVSNFKLTQDIRGMAWDLLLYIPTVIALFSMAAKFWYGEEHELAYLLVFLGSFFCISGANRVLKTRLMLLPSSPVAIEIGESANLVLRNGKCVDIVKNMRVFPDIGGHSFGISGVNGSGQSLQFVFHKGQFESTKDFQGVQAALKRLQ